MNSEPSPDTSSAPSDEGGENRPDWIRIVKLAAQVVLALAAAGKTIDLFL